MLNFSKYAWILANLANIQANLELSQGVILLETLADVTASLSALLKGLASNSCNKPAAGES